MDPNETRHLNTSQMHVFGKPMGVNQNTLLSWLYAGYVRAANKGQLSMPGQDPVLQLQVDASDSSLSFQGAGGSTAPVMLPLKWSAQFGSFSGDLAIPAGGAMHDEAGCAVRHCWQQCWQGLERV